MREERLKKRKANQQNNLVNKMRYSFLLSLIIILFFNCRIDNNQQVGKRVNGNNQFMYHDTIDLSPDSTYSIIDGKLYVQRNNMRKLLDSLGCVQYNWVYYPINPKVQYEFRANDVYLNWENYAFKITGGIVRPEKIPINKELFEGKYQNVSLKFEGHPIYLDSDFNMLLLINEIGDGLGLDFLEKSYVLIKSENNSNIEKINSLLNTKINPKIIADIEYKEDMGVSGRILSGYVVNVKSVDN